MADGKGSTVSAADTRTPISDGSQEPASEPSSAPEPELPALAPGTIVAGRYRVEREISHGGMGRILEAFDLGLERPVVLKQLRRGAPHLRRRFEREERLTARLQHPAIVPIYEAGEMPTGEPFYAMKLISGRTLHDAVAERASLRERMELLPSVIHVVEALAYAHRMGIVHRDLKPSNVVVGEFGETMVIDWGLAKDVAAADDAASAAEAPPDHDDRWESAFGEVLGTPVYMSPEQARGLPANERSDIWALGATLYHVLAGSPPYAGSTTTEVLRQVRFGPPTPVTAREEEVPPELAAIVHKAMSRDPLQRYASAREMADDLKRFQAGQLVGAHRYSAGQLLRRFARRYRAPLAVALVAAMLLVTVGAVALWRVVRERDTAEAQRSVALTQRAAAEELVVFMLGELQGKLKSVGRLDLLESVGEKVQAYYDHVSPVTPAFDAEALGRRAEAHATLGDVRRARGQLDQAAAAYEESLRLGLTLAAAQPHDPARRRALVQAYKRLGDARREQERFDDALAAFRAALDVTTRLVAESPEDGDNQALLSMCHERIGNVEVRRGRSDAALAAFQNSLGIEERLLARDPANLGQARYVAVAHERVGEAQEARGDLSGAIASYRQNLALIERVAHASPDDVELKWNLTSARNHLGNALALRGDRAAARDLFAPGVDVLVRLAAQDPSNGSWQDAIVQQYLLVGQIDVADGRPRDAVATYRRSVDLARQVVARSPGDPEWRRELAHALWLLGGTLLRLHDAGDARGPVGESLELYVDLARATPGAWTAQRDVADAHVLAGELARATGDHAGALDACRRAGAALEPIAAVQGAEGRSRRAGVDRCIAEAELALGRRGEAVAAARAALALDSEGAAVDPAAVPPQVALAESAAVLSRALGPGAEARALVTRALGILDGLSAVGRLPADGEALRASLRPR